VEPVDASAAADDPFPWSTVPFEPGCPTRTVTFVFDASVCPAWAFASAPLLLPLAWPLPLPLACPLA
jgi:hypothetical protein